MDRRVIALNLAIIVILSALYFYEANIPPTKVEIGELSKHVGEYVEIEGIVLTVSDDGKSAKISDEKFQNSATIYSDFQLRLSPGSTVVVKGIVEKYSNSYEIAPRGRSDIQVKSDSLFMSMPVLLQNPQRYVGLHVKVYGHVVYWKLIYLNVTDGENFGHFYVYGNYEGEKKTYFYGTVKNGSLRLENPLNTEEYRDATIGEIKDLNHAKIRVYGWIIGYYGHIIISQGKWSINVYYYGNEIPKGDTYIKGRFTYDESSGEYVILAK